MTTEEKKKAEEYIFTKFHEISIFKPKKMDLLENYEQLPEAVQNILLEANENDDYQTCQETIKKLEAVGYTADYDLSGTLFDLKKL